MIASPGLTITDATASSRVPPVALSANPQVMVTVMVSPGTRPKRCATALTAAPRFPPDQPEDTLVKAASSLRWSPTRLPSPLATPP